MNRPSVIIPAHNEAETICMTLECLFGKGNLAFEIVVVCNGCTDNTATVIRETFPAVRVIELATASKVLALQAADELNAGFPRIYLDADILLETQAALRLFRRAEECPDKLVVPAFRMLTDQSSRVVRQYYEAWCRTTFVIAEGYGAGTYVMNESARSRFGKWPDVISDDGFLRRIFSIEDILIDADSRVLVRAPRTLAALLRIKTRSKAGNIQLDRMFGKSTARRPRVRLRPADMLAYGIVNTLAMVRAYWHERASGTQWLRDR